jgi:hypothetical protein
MLRCKGFRAIELKASETAAASPVQSVLALSNVAMRSVWDEV